MALPHIIGSVENREIQQRIDGVKNKWGQQKILVDPQLWTLKQSSKKLSMV